LSAYTGLTTPWSYAGITHPKTGLTPNSKAGLTAYTGLTA
jgi:hypothetical protein